MKYELVRSNRRTLSIEVRPDLSVVVRAPIRMPMYRIDAFVREREEWVEDAIAKMRKKTAAVACVDKLTERELKEITKITREMVTDLVAEYADVIGVTYGRISVRRQKTRFGSCSREGNLNFNCMLAAAPERVVRYVVVHELCHRKQMNHSARFWAEVQKVLPDYREDRLWLKNNGSLLIARLP